MSQLNGDYSTPWRGVTDQSEAMQEEMNRINAREMAEADELKAAIRKCGQWQIFRDALKTIVAADGASAEDAARLLAVLEGK